MLHPKSEKFNCATCKKQKYETHTLWDRVRVFMFNFFNEDIQDVREDFYTKGYGDGYKAGMAQGLDQKRLKMTPEQIISEVTKWNKTPDEQSTN